MQRRRVHCSELGAIPLNTNVSLIATIDETNGANVHGFRAELNLIITGLTAAASHGTWAVWCMPDESSIVPDTDVSVLEAEGSNAFLWGVGLWGVTTATPCVIKFEPKTSRNCQNGARIVLKIRNNVQNGTVPSLEMLISYFTKSL